MKRTWLGLSVVVGLVFMLASPVLADFQAGLDAYERGDYHTAMKEWRPLANQGDASAQYHLGVLYERAQGIPRDYQEALRLHRLAAEQGHAQAQFDLGRMYADSPGVSRDGQEALRGGGSLPPRGMRTHSSVWVLGPCLAMGCQRMFRKPLTGFVLPLIKGMQVLRLN